jgi:hypothetical protein
MMYRKLVVRKKGGNHMWRHNMHVRVTLVIVLALAVVLVARPVPARAADCQWTGNNGSNWDDALNWNSCPSGTPGSGDTATIPDTTNDPILGSNTTIAGLTINYGAQLTINSGFTLTVDGATSLAGTLTGAGDLTVTASGTLTWSGGTMSGSGTTNANGGLTLSGSPTRYLNTRTLNNSSTATWTGGYINLYNGATINNSGTWDVQTDRSMLHDSGAISTFYNTGTFKKTAGSGTTYVDMSFNNSSTVDVQMGTVALGYSGATSTSTGGTFTVASGATLDFLGGTHTFDASSSISGAGNVDFSSGTATISSTYNVTGATSVSGATANFNIHPTSVGSSLTVSSGTANFNVASTLSPTTVTLSGNGTLNLSPDLNVTTYNQSGSSRLKGGGTVTVSGMTTWSGGHIKDAGTFNANGGLTVNGSTKYLDTRTLNNPGTATWTGGDILLYNGATINNSGTWDVQTDNALDYGSGAISAFNNTGTFKKTAGSGTTYVDMNFNNSSAVDVQTGTVHFDYDLTNGSGGVVEIDKDATLTVNGTLTNNGTMKQTQTVNASTVEFLHITNASGDTDKYCGVIINTSGNMADTTVSIKGNQNCGTAGTLGSTVKRCYGITPTTSQTATVTFYYLDSEANSNTAPNVYHWNGSSWVLQTYDAQDTSGDPNWVRASGISSYSPFALSDNEPTGGPTAVTLSSFVAKPSTGLEPSLVWPWLVGVATLAMGSVVWVRQRLNRLGRTRGRSN